MIHLDLGRAVFGYVKNAGIFYRSDVDEFFE
jgi:hypothetical protein